MAFVVLERELMASGGANMTENDPNQTSVRSFEGLDMEARAEMSYAGVDDRSIRMASSVLAWLYEQHPPTAQGCVEIMPLARASAETIKEISPKLPVDMASVALSSLLHDSLKPIAGLDLLEKSERGEEWTPVDRLRMQVHAPAAYQVLGEIGFPEDVTKPVAEHHNPQITGSYGLWLSLSPSQRVTRDVTAGSDSLAAMFTRHNTYNAHLNINQRAAAIRPNLELSYDTDFYGGAGQEITDVIMARTTEMIMPIAKQRLPQHVFVENV